MNIKYLLSSLVILLSVSFSANAENVYRVYMVSWGGAPLKEGQIITDSYISSIRFSNFSNCRAIFNRIECDQSPYSRRTEIGRMNRLTCPDGQEIDPITGQCKSKPYCEEQSTIDAMSQYHDSCTANGGTPKLFCDNNTQSFDADCELPDQCTPDSDDWPACKDDEPEPDPDQCDSSSPDWVDSVGKCCNESNNWCDEPVTDDSCTIFSRTGRHVRVT